MCGTELAYAATQSMLAHTLEESDTAAVLDLGIALRASYEMSGTEIACGAIFLRTAIRFPVPTLYGPICLRCCYAMPGAEGAYGSMGITLRACYAMSGTDLAYDAISSEGDYHPTEDKALSTNPL
eukprot:3940563-Rhodomonas_salina.2